MDTSFYTAARGARTMQKRIDIISNNIANLNTKGFHAADSKFQDLMYYNMRKPEGEPSQLQAGTGVKLVKSDIDFRPGLVEPTGSAMDFAIKGEDGFFRLYDPVTRDITYTRNGHLNMSEREDGFYLVTDSGKFMINAEGQPIKAKQVPGSSENIPDSKPAVVRFDNTDGMLAIGNNEYTPVMKNGEPYLVDAEVVSGYLESGNADLAEEMAKTVEASRAYAYALKMVQTSDEVEQTINNLR